MAALIARLRLMVEDVTNPQQYTDEQLQSYLDSNRVRLADAPCGFDALRLEFTSPYPNLEANAQVRQPGAGAVMAHESANFDAGTFTFAVAQTFVPAVWGYAYDLHAAAAEVWTSKAGRSKNWQGQYGLLAQQQIQFHRRQSWAHNGTASRVVEDLYFDRYSRGDW